MDACTSYILYILVPQTNPSLKQREILIIKKSYIFTIPLNEIISHFLPPFILIFYWLVPKELRKLYCTANAAFAITALTNVDSSPNKLSENNLYCLFVENHKTSLEYFSMQVQSIILQARLCFFARKSKWFSLLSSIQCCSVVEAE